MKVFPQMWDFLEPGAMQGLPQMWDFLEPGAMQGLTGGWAGWAAVPLTAGAVIL